MTRRDKMLRCGVTAAVYGIAAGAFAGPVPGVTMALVGFVTAVLLLEA